MFVHVIILTKTRIQGGNTLRIDFFSTSEGMDQRAVNHGVYSIELVGRGKKICLYIGESVWIASRCGVHLYELYEDPGYFGLTKDDLNNDEFTLKFSVIESISDKKTLLGIGEYKQLELKAIKSNKPLTQLETSDRQIRNKEEKIKKVQGELTNQGFK